MPKPTKLITIRVPEDSNLPERLREIRHRLRLPYHHVLERLLDREEEASSEAENLTNKVSELENRVKVLEKGRGI